MVVKALALLPEPKYKGQLEGQIVIEITVNWEGIVTKTHIQVKGTNIGDEKYEKKC